MDYWPNIDAASWFATDVMPHILAAQPAARFYVVGMNPSAEVRDLERLGHVTVTGRVDDVRPWVAHAACAVAPLRVARGIQNKVLEAMAMARPVVLSAAPAVGLAARDGVECSIADDGDELCRRVVELLGDPSRRAAIGAAARDCVLRAYSWSAHLRTLDWLLDAQGTDAGLAQAVQAREGAAPNAPALVRTP
jgi:glycosyltransferase involved in cell wall biosynthesis